MPKTPAGAKRPTDVVSNAVHIMRVLTGEAEDEMPPEDDGKDKAAQSMGRRGGAGARGVYDPGAAVGDREGGGGQALEKRGLDNFFFSSHK